MGILDNFRSWLLQPLLEPGTRERLERVDLLRNYRTGNHKRFLKKSNAGFDDNIVVNFSGLVVDRSVTMLFGKGITFDLPGEAIEQVDEQGNVEKVPPENQRYIDAVLDANKQQILLHKIAMFGAEQGTCYLQIVPDAIPYKLDGEDVLLPRLIALDPAWIRIETNPHDIEDVLRYVIEYIIIGPDGREEAHRQIIERDDGVEVDEDGAAQILRPVAWTITRYVSTAATQGRWQQVGDVDRWEHEFAPILHWQNLPEPTSAYGRPDVTDDIIELQDRINFTASNISKIIRLYAHPQRYSRHFGSATRVEVGPNEMPNFNNDNGGIFQLEPAGDLAAASGYLAFLRQAMFDISQTVDISSMADKLNALTNFGLRVLYQDALAKLGTKRELYGDALLELVRRLLVLSERFTDTDPGVIRWPEVLPLDELQQVQVLKADIDLGIVSRQTAAHKRGYDWEQEQPRIEAEAEAAQARQASLGAFLLRDFNGGGGGGLFGNQGGGQGSGQVKL